MRRWTRLGILACACLAFLVVAAVLFQPWQLFVNRRVDEAVPVVPAGDPSAPVGAAATEEPTASPAPSGGRRSPTARPSPRPVRKPVTIATGQFIEHEHATRGTVQVIELPNGERILRFTDLRTSSGPDLRVWLSSGPVVEGRAGWFVFGKHPHHELGKLKANQGNQNYAIPAEVDIEEFASATIWCKRFHVSFGAAALQPVAT